MRTRILGYAAAVLFHLFVIFLGGLLFLAPPPQRARKQVAEVDLVTADEKDGTEDEEADPEQQESRESMDDVREAPPDPGQLDVPTEPVAAVAGLDALSLGALESALDPALAAGGFSTSTSFASGGRIGGTGTAAGPSGPGDGAADGSFGLANPDQSPRPIFTPQPSYPFEMRQKKEEGAVVLLFVVDSSGRVVEPRVESATHQAFVKPALDSIRQWRFEPAVRGGQKVPARARKAIRFTIG